MPRILVKPLTVGVLGTNCYIVASENKQAMIVDPGDDADYIERIIADNKLIPRQIIATHGHFDHIMAVLELKLAYNIPFKINFQDKFLVNNMYSSAKHFIGIEPGPPPPVDGPLSEKDKIKIGSGSLTVLETSGHTPGSICLYNKADKILFTGDTLFTAGCGRLFEGTAEQMYQSLEKLKKLSPSIQVYCGHEYTEDNLKFAKLVEPNNKTLQQRIKTTREYREHEFPTVPAPLALELQTNPFLRCQEPEVIQAAEHHAGKSLSDPVQVFATLRQWKTRS